MCPELVLILILVGYSTQDTESKLECEKLSDPVLLEPGRLPVTALASFQGSGNTWVRQVLASATGYKSGDIFSSYGDDAFPEFSSLHDDRVIAIKTHYFSAYANQIYKRAIVITRHPLDALFAEFNRVYGGNKTGYADPSNFLHEDGVPTWQWDVWMTHIGAWVNFHIYWLSEFRGDVHLIYYDNLKIDLYGELERTIKFLGLQPNYERLNCTVYHPKPPYFQRTHTKLPVDKKHLFKFSSYKATKALDEFKQLVIKKYGEGSHEVNTLNIKLSVDLR